ncbi:MAG: biotin--[acetyl-CoA-carboxylase] ligase [bacterium]
MNFSSRFSNFYHFDTVSSTMEKAVRLIERGVSRGVVIADFQTGGYGRNGKSWFSPDNGNLYLSFFEKLDRDAPLDLIPQRTALSVLLTVEKFVNSELISLKWPNDILINNKKCSGIIAKSVQWNFERFYIGGIGINVFMPETNLFKHTWEVGALSEYSQNIESKQVLTELVKALDVFFEIERGEVIKKYLSSISWMVSKKIAYTTSGSESKNGAVSGFNDDGSVIKIRENSEISEMSAVSILKIF